MSVKPGQHDAQLFWLTLLSAVRDASGADRCAEPPPTTPCFNGLAMLDQVLTEISAAGYPFVLVIDGLHELKSAEAAEQLTSLLTSLPSHTPAIVATRRDPPLRLHQLRLAVELAEIRAAQLRFTEEETRQLVAAAPADRAVHLPSCRVYGPARGGVPDLPVSGASHDRLLGAASTMLRRITATPSEGKRYWPAQMDRALCGRRFRRSAAGCGQEPW